jgi:TonB family protein
MMVGTKLVEVAMPSVSLKQLSESVLGDPLPKPSLLPTLFGEGYGNYRARRSTFAFSFAAHFLVIALVVWLGKLVTHHRHTIGQKVIGIVTDISPYVLPPSLSKVGGGGGGGDRDSLAASKGKLPRFSREQLTPPIVVVRNENPKLKVEPTVVVPPEIHLPMPQSGPLGDPLSSILGPPSSGTGSGGGIGSGSGGGVGSGRGPGVGPGWGGGIGGGAYTVGGGVTAPRAIYTPEPEFSEEARKTKYQGTVVLRLIVGTDGRPRDIGVVQSLGMGLDEKAIEALRLWRFEPGRKAGVAVAVLVNIEVNFHLY